MKFKQGTAVILAMLLSACATNTSAPFEGSSHANPTLRSDTYNMISMLTAAKGCPSIDKIETAVVEPPSGEPGRQKSSENWLVHGCNATYNYNVSFTEDGAGGSFFSVGVGS